MLETWIIALLGPHWKTSLQGILSTIIALSGSAAFVGQLNPKAAATLMTMGGLAKAALGVFQKDAGQQEAYVPGKGIETVASHESPNDPNAIPVVHE